jgi:hypothetical protein
MGAVALARLAGMLYLAVAILSAWAHLTSGSVYVPSDPGASAAAVAENTALLRWAVVADVLMTVAFVALGLALQRLLHEHGPRLASAIVVFTSVSATSVLVTLIFVAGAVAAATDVGYVETLGEPGRDALVQLMLDLQRASSTLNGVFFGLWLVPVGVLTYRSGRIPRALGVVVLVGAASWIIGVALSFVAADLRDATLTISTVAEIVLLLWLLVVGVRPRSVDA